VQKKKWASHLKCEYLSGMVSPEDMRYMKEIISKFRVKGIMLPDYSERLEGLCGQSSRGYRKAVRN
jgi:hypothetical protein